MLSMVDVAVVGAPVTSTRMGRATPLRRGLPALQLFGTTAAVGRFTSGT